MLREYLNILSDNVSTCGGDAVTFTAETNVVPTVYNWIVNDVEFKQTSSNVTTFNFESSYNVRFD